MVRLTKVRLATGNLQIPVAAEPLGPTKMGRRWDTEGVAVSSCRDVRALGSQAKRNLFAEAEPGAGENPGYFLAAAGPAGAGGVLSSQEPAVSPQRFSPAQLLRHGDSVGKVTSELDSRTRKRQ